MKQKPKNILNFEKYKRVFSIKENQTFFLLFTAAIFRIIETQHRITRNPQTVNFSVHSKYVKEVFDRMKKTF